MFVRKLAVAGSITCAVSLCTAAALPEPAKPTAAPVQAHSVRLAALDLSGIAGFSALPLYLNGLSNPLALISGFDGTNAIPLFLNLALTGDISTFLDNYAALNGVTSLIGLAGGDLSQLDNIDGFSAISAYRAALSGNPAALLSLSSLSAIPTFAQFVASGGNTDVFLPTEDAAGNLTNPGYAALGGISALRNFLATGDISAFDDQSGPNAIPRYDALSGLTSLRTALGPGSTPAQRILALSNIDAFSALSTYLGVTPPADDGGDSDNPGGDPTGGNPPVTPGGTGARALSSVAKVGVAVPATESNLTTEATPADESTPAPAAAVSSVSAPVAPVAPATDEDADAPAQKTPSKGSYSGKFAPKQLVLFGSGGGKNAADNGIRGWGKVAGGLRGALGMKPEGGDAAKGADGGDGS